MAFTALANSHTAGACRTQLLGRQSRSPRCQRLQLVCCSADDKVSAADRRAVLAGIAGVLAATPLISVAPAHAATKQLPASAVTTLQRRAILKELQNRAEEEFNKVLTPADAPACLRLMLHDVGTYDVATKAGGANGSVILAAELDRPENRDLKPLVDKLKQAKAAIDARRQEGQGELSWADTIVLAAKVTTEAAWRQDKISKAASPEKGAFIADGFGNAISVRLGRLDASEPAPAGRLLSNDASLEEVQAYFAALGPKGGVLSKLGQTRGAFLVWPALQQDPAATEAAMAAANKSWADWKRFYDSSRQTVTRTSYEEDFGKAFGLLANLGAKFDNERYMCPVQLNIPDRL